MHKRGKLENFPQTATDELQMFVGTKWDQDSNFDI